MKKYTFEHGILAARKDGAVHSYISLRTKLKYGFLLEGIASIVQDPDVDVRLPLSATCIDGRNITITYNADREAVGHPFPAKITSSLELDQAFDASCFALLQALVRTGHRSHDALLGEFFSSIKCTENARGVMLNVFNRYYEEFNTEFYNAAV